ncbi:hypothetical protein [Enterovibrio norvegicus]|uniref:hypothetical protein n=1 Tax=Enterovibrio norvegicus TaxID=188144 RepID=UPI00352F1CF1
MLDEERHENPVFRQPKHAFSGEHERDCKDEREETIEKRGGSTAKRKPKQCRKQKCSARTQASQKVHHAKMMYLKLVAARYAQIKHRVKAIYHSRLSSVGYVDKCSKGETRSRAEKKLPGGSFKGLFTDTEGAKDPAKQII